MDLVSSVTRGKVHICWAPMHRIWLVEPIVAIANRIAFAFGDIDSRIQALFDPLSTT